jgi:putative ABC transport system permease protein
MTALINGLIRPVWQLADAELELRPVANGEQVELRSQRVFLDPPISQVALNVITNATGKKSGIGILTYLVNELRLGDRATPYSMVTAIANLDSFVESQAGPKLNDDDILINQWLADDLKAKLGDTIEISYYVVGPARKLEEQKASFKIRAILPMRGVALDRDLMPDFPGITDAQNCRDWNAGFQIKTERIRDQDEKYWSEYRGTPKAFVTLAAGQKMWANRFGNLTAVRYSAEKNLSAGTNMFPPWLELRSSF